MRPAIFLWLVGGGPGWGIAAGILFAGGDVSTKMAVSGGLANAAFFVSLIAFYGAGTAVLQAGFQRGGALTTAGLATLLTNALPIAAGMIVFAEPLPGGWIGAIRIVAFAAVIAGAVLLSVRRRLPRRRPRWSSWTSPRPRSELAHEGTATRARVGWAVCRDDRPG